MGVGLAPCTQRRDSREGHKGGTHARDTCAAATLAVSSCLTQCCRASQAAERGAAGASDEELLSVLEPAMYLPLGDKAAAWLQWLRRWLRAQEGEGGDGAEAARWMRLVSPKYIPREWMLAEAYTGAELCGKQPPRGFGQFSLQHAPPAPDQAQGGLPPRPALAYWRMRSGWPAIPTSIVPYRPWYSRRCGARQPHGAAHPRAAAAASVR